MEPTREFLIIDLKTREVERRISVSRCPRKRSKTWDGLYRKVDEDRYYVEEYIGGYTLNRSKGRILDLLEQDRFKRHDAQSLAMATGYSVSWCRATAMVLERNGEILGSERDGTKTWSFS